MQTLIHAAVAVLQRPDGQVLLAQRPSDKTWAGWWEFPGGKIEAGETPAQALARELDEELGMQVLQAYPWITREHQYPEKTVKLHFFRVVQWQGEPQSCEGQQWAWQDVHQLSVSPLLPANQVIIQSLRLPHQLAISHLAEMGEAAFMQAFGIALAKGLRLMQLREKQLSSEQLEPILQRLLALARPYGCQILLHGQHQDLALRHDCGIHLSSHALMQLEHLPAAWQGRLLGASCHNAHELQRAYQLDVSYAFLSPVQATRSHPDTAPLGWSAFAQHIQDSPIPIYALGGMTEQDLPLAWQAGAHGIAMQRGMW